MAVLDSKAHSNNKRHCLKLVLEPVERLLFDAGGLEFYCLCLNCLTFGIFALLPMLTQVADFEDLVVKGQVTESYYVFRTYTQLLYHRAY